MADKLDNALIADTSRWRLLLGLDNKGLDVLIYCPGEDNTLIYRNIAFDAAAPTQQKALDDAVYENPLLLRDYDRITVLLHSQNRLFVPCDTDEPDADTMRSLLTLADPEATPAADILTSTLHPLQGVVETAAVDPRTLGFVRRTFFNAVVMEHLTPLCRYFAATAQRGMAPRIAVSLRPGVLDLVAFSGNRLLLANTFEWREPADAVYYILACRKTLGIDQADILLAGNAVLREQLMPELKRFVPRVMPVIFPSQMFSAGKDAMKAPFELIAAALI